VLAPKQEKDNDPKLMTLVPHPGMEREAFASVIGNR